MSKSNGSNVTFMNSLVNIFKKLAFWGEKQERGKTENKEEVLTKFIESVPDFERESSIKIIFPDEEESAFSTFKGIEFRTWIWSIGEVFWRRGFNDGKLGQKKAPIYEMAKSSAFFVRDKIKSTYEGHLSKLETELELIREVHKDARHDYKKNDDYDKRITEEYRRNPRNFSKTLAIIYLLFAVLLVFADIPLALKLTQAGFDLDLGENFIIQDLFKHPLGVFQENWEVILLAFGIALCTIYVKIFYDEFLGSPIEKNTVMLKNLEGIESNDEKRKIKSIHFGRLAFKIFVLIFTLGTIYMLGQFRFETIEYQNRLKALAYTGESFEDVDELFTSKETTSSPPKVEDPREVWRKTVTKYTFIAITLLFPIIGGICASLGLNNLEKIRELKKSKRLCEDATKGYLEASTKLKEANKSLSNWQSALKWCESNGFIKHLLSLFLNFYDHGYQRGLLVPENLLKGTDLYEKAEQLRNKLISRKIFEAIQNAKGGDDTIDFNKMIEKEFGDELEAESSNEGTKPTRKKNEKSK